MKQIKKDVLIIGSGLSGLYTSLHLDQTLEIGVVSKDNLVVSNSVLAQGGIASCTNKEDSYLAHLKDTLLAGSHVNNIDAVSMLVSQAPEEIHQLIEMGVDFDKDDNGMILTTLEGGHSHKRILHANGDATGKVIMETVVHQTLQRKNIEVFEKTMAIEIVKNNKEEIIGVIVLQKNKFVFIKTPIVVIATGGIGALYKDTTNHGFSTGDGIALAKKAGCELVNMCYVQFHPTAFYSHTKEKRFLISEALRGEGGILRNHQGDAFMSRYDQRGDLAPRDVVARGIYNEMQVNNQENIWLDMTFKDRDVLEKRFPTIYAYLVEQGIYMEKDFIPVAPVAHYFVGGIATNLDGQTSVSGVYACGEVSSTGVHGANRLASNSLLECVVFGKRTANHINKLFSQGIVLQENNEIDNTGDINTNTNKDINTDINRDLNLYMGVYKALDFEECNQPIFEECDYLEYKEKIQAIMTNSVGIIRRNDELKKALKMVEEIEMQLTSKPIVCTLYFEALNMSLVAKEVILDAYNKESIGCHFKEKTVEVLV